MKKLNRLISLITIWGLTCGVGFTQTSRQPKAQNSTPQQAVTPAASSNPVTGSGTVGRIAKWTGVDGSNSFSIGNTNIFEDKFGKVGIGTITPTSPLTVQGMIETTLGGYKFPDGTVQTTAGLSSIFHNATLTGNGTQASPLGVAIPLTLTGAEPNVTIAILQSVNTATLGRGLLAQGGPSGTGMTGVGGDSPKGGGGVGVEAFGGAGASSPGGPGVQVTGGVSNGNASAGIGIIVQGGFNLSNGPGAAGVDATGGVGTGGGNNGPGVKATGGDSSPLGASRPGDGVVATGGNYLGPDMTVTGGSGVVAKGGSGREHGGDGIVASGGGSISNTAGVGVRATGGMRNLSDGTQAGAEGIIATGGNASGTGRAAGNGLVANPGVASNGATPGRAALFGGEVFVFGDFNVTGTKNFKMDHPLDPANKYLYHAAIESSEILNVYSGNVKANKKGEAIVTLPDWFEALNKDFRYQLTPIGAPAQGLYIAEKVFKNRFKIAGAKPNMEISWQVTGIRSDAATRQLTFKVEEEKPVHERGTYLAPEAYGEPKEKGIKWARNPQPIDETQPADAKQAEVSKAKAQGRNR